MITGNQTKNKIVLTFAALMTTAIITASAQETVVPITDVTGSHGGNYAGTLAKMIDGSGMTQPDTSDPSTWTTSSGAYQDEWQAVSLLSGASNSKIAWCAFDLGSATVGLQDLYLWNVREGSGDRGTKTYNIYYADSPTVPLPPAPPTNTAGSDYDFAGGGWTLFNTSGVLTLAQKGAAPAPADGVVDLGGITARYIGLEILTNWGTTWTRVGLAEVAFTASDDPNLPFVNAGVDMITLSGMGVALAPTVVNNDTEEPQKPLSYEWMTDAPGGYTVEWDPSNTVEAPTVTITPDTPGNPQTVTLTLKVDLVGTSSSASDTMEIDVYNDACLAAKAVGPVELSPSDFDENCTTDLRDYAVLAAKWLVDYTLTAPIAKP